MTEKINLKLLKKEIPHKWKVQSFVSNKTKCTCVAYIDARQVCDLLDEVVGMENWKEEFFEVKNNLYCKILIKVNDEWIGKSDCGTESSMEKEKGESSDAFKRAAVKWGIGRFLYSKDIKHLPVKPYGNSFCPVDNEGKFLFGSKLTQYIEKSENIPVNEKCPKCGAKLMTSKQGKKYCSALCWKN